jgi:hypothetical protein
MKEYECDGKNKHEKKIIQKYIPKFYIARTLLKSAKDKALFGLSMTWRMYKLL